MLKKFTTFLSPYIKRECNYYYSTRGSCLGKSFKSRKCNLLSKPVCTYLNTISAGFSSINSQKTCSLSEGNIKELSEDDPETEKFVRVLLLELDIFRQDGEFVPDNMSLHHWRELLALKNRSSRLRYLKFLFINEKKDENKRMRKEKKAIQRQELKKEVADTGHIFYGFGGSTMFIRIYPSTMDGYLNKNLMNAAMFSQPLVYDCSYDIDMTKIEARNCARQMCMLFSDNRNHKEPFHLQFCNANPNSYLMQCLHKYFPQMYDPHYPFFVTEKSFTELYPKEKLVYLTPHCKNDLIEYSHDDIYIVGAMVDKVSPKPLSLAKAKEQGLRMAKLPLERHLVWGSGATKSLTLNQMASILLDMRHYNDWQKAFLHIPRRKIITDEELIKEAKEKRNKPLTRPRRKEINEVPLSSNIIRSIMSKN